MVSKEQLIIYKIKNLVDNIIKYGTRVSNEEIKTICIEDIEGRRDYKKDIGKFLFLWI